MLPGRLSVCRTFGDPEAKLEYRGGNPNVVKAEPEIKTFRFLLQEVAIMDVTLDGTMHDAVGEHNQTCDDQEEPVEEMVSLHTMYRGFVTP